MELSRLDLKDMQYGMQYRIIRHESSGGVVEAYIIPVMRVAGGMLHDVFSVLNGKVHQAILNKVLKNNLEYPVVESPVEQKFLDFLDNRGKLS